MILHPIVCLLLTTCLRVGLLELVPDRVTVDSLEADIADRPSEGGLHLRDFDIYVATDDSTAANS